MARVCAYRMCHLFLTAAVFLLGFSLVGDDIYAKSSSRDERSNARRERVQHLLSDQQIDDSDAIKLIFKEDDNALPALLTALREGKNVERASWALASLGGPKEREILRNMIGAEKDDEKKLLMSSFLAGALVEPSSDKEWLFLETCLRGYKDESPASFSAALALGVNGSPQALHLLQSVVPTDQSLVSDNDTVQEVRQAIRWIEQRSSKGNKETTRTETGSDSEQIKHIVLENAFYAGGKRERFSVEDIVFTREKNRALVSVEIDRSPKEAQGYDIVLERSSGMWRIVGVWATWAT